jgi:hypothetical protein
MEIIGQYDAPAFSTITESVSGSHWEVVGAWGLLEIYS